MELHVVVHLSSQPPAHTFSSGSLWARIYLVHVVVYLSSKAHARSLSGSFKAIPKVTCSHQQPTRSVLDQFTAGVSKLCNIFLFHQTPIVRT